MKSIQLFLLLVALYSVAAEVTVGYKRTNVTIDDIEKFEVKDSSPCPDSSSSVTPSFLKDSNGKEYVACEYQYLCHKNEPCLLFNVTASLSQNPNNQLHGYYAYNSVNATEKLIPISCNETQLKDGQCGTEQCTSNADCYSNNCVNNVCMVDNNNPAYLCKTMKENDKLMVKCLLSYQEACKTDADCGDGASCGIDSVCVTKQNVKDESKSTKYIIIGIIVLAIIVALIALNFIVKNKKKPDELGNRFHL